MAKKKPQVKAPPNKSASNGTPKEETNGHTNGTSSDTVEAADQSLRDLKLSVTSATGVLASHPQSRDLKIENFSMSLLGHELISDTMLELSYGRRYGLIGLNGSGKSTLLTVISHREIPIPAHISVFHLEHEVSASEKTALEAVVESMEETKAELEAEAELIAGNDDPESQERVNDIYNELDELDADTALTRAGKILHGLGFSKAMQAKQCKDFSGGWRMRIALAKALFARPTMLLLDEPTNHLDLEACVWLEEWLKKYNKILVMISHSQDFLNGVCTNIIHLQNGRLSYYTGNYDTYVQARAEKEVNQMKRYDKEQEQIAHMKDYIARFGHGSAKLASQAQSKEKVLAKMEAKGLTERVVADKVLILKFNDCGKIPPPVLQFNKVSFAYPGQSEIYHDLEFGIDLDSRVALVGPNGAGKSTLLKLMVGSNPPNNGVIRRHTHLRIAWFHQHLSDLLDLELSPLDYMMKAYPEVTDPENMRRIIGRFGITGKLQTQQMKFLSDGMKSRVVLSYLAYKSPHLLLLDEPTNHLDMETIDSLAAAINEFEGGLVLVSHDFRLISQVAKEIWVCNNKKVTKWNGTIQDYKAALRAQVLKDTN